MKKKINFNFETAKQQAKYYAIYKPYEMLSQFTDDGERKGLKHLYDFPKDVYPIGRLDADSEGLLLLTNDNKIKHILLTPEFKHKRTYCVQVEGLPTEEALAKLREGVEINLKGQMYLTLPAEVAVIDEPSDLPARYPPIRFRAHIPTTWLQITLREGKNRQIRRMTASVGLPTLRLVRVSIGDILVGKSMSGDVWELERQDFNFLM